jgi:NADH dehydrogenase
VTAHRVVVVGGGFGGLQAVRGLRRAPVEVTLVDRQNYTLFQPLVYQVATGALSPAEIAPPLRTVLRRQRNARVVLAEVTGLDLERREVLLDGLPSGGSVRLGYDTLVVAGGSQYSYFGHDGWREHAPELKSLAGALRIRSRILAAFEAAETETDPERRRAWLTFVVVGGGPTGVEIAGQIAELAHDALRRDFRAVDTGTARVLLVEATGRILGTFPEPLSHTATRALGELGVTTLAAHTVVDVGDGFVAVRTPAGGVERIAARTTIWAAGVTASGLAAELARRSGAELDRAGRLTVAPDLAVPGHPEVLALGDMVRVQGADGAVTTYPGLAPVAMQQGRYAARAIRARLRGRVPGPFRYRDKGNLATIGRSRAVADVKGVRIAGFPAWVLWLTVHIAYLIGFQNRLLVLLRWTISFLTRGRGARLILEPTTEGSARMNDDDGKAVLQRYAAAVQAGDAETIRRLFAEDATWTLAAGSLPISGTWRGRDTILTDFLGRALARYEPGSVDLEITGMIAEGDRVVVQWTSRARTADGRPYENECIGVFTVRDGRITAVREYMDTLYAHDTAFRAVAA